MSCNVQSSPFGDMFVSFDAVCNMILFGLYPGVLVCAEFSPLELLFVSFDGGLYLGYCGLYFRRGFVLYEIVLFGIIPGVIWSLPVFSYCFIRHESSEFCAICLFVTCLFLLFPLFCMMSALFYSMVVLSLSSTS